MLFPILFMLPILKSIQGKSSGFVWNYFDINKYLDLRDFILEVNNINISLTKKYLKVNSKVRTFTL